MGKLIEHVVLNCVQNHMDANNLFQDTMLGFRPHLSTQDTTPCISEEVINPIHKKRTRSILALDLAKAFNNVDHKAFLTSLSDRNVGERVHSYIEAFLSDRTVEIQIGSLQSHLPSKW